MYGFLYKKFTSHRGIVYNGDTANLKHTIDPIEAQKWFDKTKDSFKSVKVKRLDSYINLNFPLVTEGEEDLGIGEYINKSNVSLSTQQFMHQFLNQFIFTKDGFFKERFKGVSEDQEKIGTLLSMRNMIEGLIRWKPIKVEVGVDKKTNNPRYSNWYIHQNFGATDTPNSEEIENSCYIPKMFTIETKDGPKKIPIMGAYSQKLLAAVFPRPQFSGRRLQIWQQRFLLERGQQTVVLAPREGGKCSAFGSMIRMFDGTFKRAEDLVIGDRLLSSNRKGFVNVTNIDFFKKECNKITLDNGMSKIVSHDHRIPLAENYSRNGWDMDIDSYTKARDIEIGQHLATNIGFSGSGGEYREGLLTGTYLGDGCNQTNQISCYNDEFAKYILSYYDGSYGKGSIYINVGQYDKNYRGVNGISYNKKIKNELFSMSNEFKWGMVCGLIATDGHIDGRRISYCSTSLELAKGVQTIYADLGIYSTLREKKFTSQFKSNTGNICFIVEVCDKGALSKIIRNTNLSYKKNYTKLVEKLSIEITNTNGKNNIPLIAFKECEVKSLPYKGNNRKRGYNGVREAHYDFNRNKCFNYQIEHWLDYSWCKVVSNENIGLYDVVSIEVDGDHTYYIDNILTHNSLVAAFLAFTYLMRQYTDFDDETRGITIHYFGLDEKQLDTVGNYVVGMVSKMIDNKKAIKYLKTDMEVVLNDGGNPAKIKLMSSLGASLGRGERPSLVIIDEAGYTNEEVHKIAQGTAGIPIVMITTVNPSTKRNRAYDLALEGLAQQRQYESIEETITRIFFKYGLDKVTTKEQLEEMYEKRIFRAMKDELHYSRPLVTLKFTIDDRENITEQAKELTLIAARKKGEKFLAAEHYSEYVEELTLFNSDGLYEQDLPEKYDVGYVGYDPAYKYDNPALCLGGYKNGLLYIEESIILPSDPVERTKKIKSMTELFRQKCKRIITLMDTTQDEEQYETMETRGYVIDVPCKWTNGGGINYSGRVHLVGKKVLVNDVSKEVFFDRSIIRFSSKLIGEKSLSEELQYYTLLKSGKYGASQGKDDQVSAMMLVCYGCYIDTMKGELSSERYLGYDPEQLEMIKEQERLNELYYEDYSNNRENAIVNGLL